MLIDTCSVRCLTDLERELMLLAFSTLWCWSSGWSLRISGRRHFFGHPYFILYCALTFFAAPRAPAGASHPGAGRKVPRASKAEKRDFSAQRCQCCTCHCAAAVQRPTLSVSRVAGAGAAFTQWSGQQVDLQSVASICLWQNSDPWSGLAAFNDELFFNDLVWVLYCLW
jgi:hypothetical protein